MVRPDRPGEPPPMPLQTPNPPAADARKSILAAATSLFAERGFHGTTMRDIAERAAVSQGLLHHHFGNKEGLWKRAGDALSDEFVVYVSSVLGDPGPASQMVPMAMQTYLRYWRENPDAFRFNLWRLLEGPADERKRRSAMITERTVPLFERAQKEGLLRDDMPAGLVMIVIGALIQFWLHSRVEVGDALAATKSPVPDDQEFLATILKLVAAAPATPSKKPMKRRPK